MMGNTLGSIDTMPALALRAIHMSSGVIVMIDQKVLSQAVGNRWAL
jgi:hypothetical protein